MLSLQLFSRRVHSSVQLCPLAVSTQSIRPPATPPEPTAPSIFLQPQTTVLLTDLTKITGREKYRNKGTSSEADHLLNMMEAMFEHSRDSGSIVLSEDVTAVG